MLRPLVFAPAVTCRNARHATLPNLTHLLGGRRNRWQPPHRFPPTRTSPVWPRDLHSPQRAFETPPPGLADSRSTPSHHSNSLLQASVSAPARLCFGGR